MTPSFESIATPYRWYIEQQKIPLRSIPFYVRWLRLYLEACQKNDWQPGQAHTIPSFLKNIHPQAYSPFLYEQAQQAVTLYHQMQKVTTSQTPVASIPEKIEAHLKTDKIKMALTENPEINSSLNKTSSDWSIAYTKMSQVIMLQHYSSKTHKSYTNWVKQFEGFTQSKFPNQLNQNDVKSFLSHLAVHKKVSASSQNQAFHALLFFFCHALNKDWGQIKDVVRAKHKPYIPVVLSRTEINQVLEQFGKSLPLNRANAIWLWTQAI